MNDLHQLSATFRSILEHGACDTRLPMRTRFPHGTCGDASILLSMWLVQNGISGIEYVAGMRGKGSHAWLVVSDHIVDITCDQFAEGLPAVVCTRSSTWHDSFEVHTRHSATVDDYDPLTRRNLHRAYEALMKSWEKRHNTCIDDIA